MTHSPSSFLLHFGCIRQFCLELNALVLLLQDVCTPGTCPQMKATDELLYLCAAHKQPLECSAIDYIVHTLDSIAAQLNSNKFFPSRYEFDDDCAVCFPRPLGHRFLIVILLSVSVSVSLSLHHPPPPPRASRSVTIQKASVKHFQAIARRLYRIFAHTYFHHRQVYDKYEEQTQLTERFVRFAKQYDLVPESLMVISQPAGDGASSSS